MELTIILVGLFLVWFVYQNSPQYRERQTQKHTEKLEDYAYKIFFELIDDYEKKIKKWEKDAKKEEEYFISRSQEL